jgi:hypothetical protein
LLVQASLRRWLSSDLWAALRGKNFNSGENPLCERVLIS